MQHPPLLDAYGMAEVGATEEELMALFGRSKPATARIYTTMVNKLKLAKTAIPKLETAMRGKTERERGQRDLDGPQQPDA